jgi:carboxynorspermidine decarboxylase
MTDNLFLAPFADLDRHGGDSDLPHWRQDAALVFVTWRLADAFPQAVLDELEEKKAAWLKAQSPRSGDTPVPGIDARACIGGKSAPAPNVRDFYAQLTVEEEAALNAGHGSCLLRNPELARQVEAALLHEDGVRYDLVAYAIMPNHVHVLVSLRRGTTLENVMRAWKGVSARAINQEQGTRGSLWQANYWDRLIRNRRHFEHVRGYILQNPVRAHLREGTFIVNELRTVSDTGDLVCAGGRSAPAPMFAHTVPGTLANDASGGKSAPAPMFAHTVPGTLANDASGGKSAPAPMLAHTVPGTLANDASGGKSAPAPMLARAASGSGDTPVPVAETRETPGGKSAPAPKGVPIPTPCFVVDAAALARNLAVLAEVKRRTGCRVLLALKAFSMFSVFPQMRRALDGCCASSVHEARLGREAFGGEVHAFAAAFSEADMRELAGLVDHVTLNSFAQLRQFQRVLGSTSDLRPPTSDLRSPTSDLRPPLSYGLRINPEHSEGHTEIYDPCAPRSRLGVRRATFDGESLDGITGLHCHNLCEQGSEPFARTVAAIEAKFGDLLPRLSWFNFGGGHHITRGDYDLDLLCDTLNAFRSRHPNIETLYLEPGEACALNAGTLVATVLDVVENELPIAILDASCACHMPDVMEMPYRPRVFRDADWTGEAEPGPGADRGEDPGVKRHTVRLAGATCLAGDIIGDWSFDAPLRPGDRVIFEDMAHYTMVKTNTFNGIRLPTIAVREAGGTVRAVKSFGYDDFKSRLS